jgi:hypothetical protein
MKKILLSTVAVATLATVSNAASELETLKAQMTQMMKKIESLESNQAASAKKIDKLAKYTHVKSKVPTLKFSGTHYLGFVNDDLKGENKFETRRNYFQVKAYMNKHDYFRTTFDTYDENGDSKIRLKYVYLYLDNVLSNTGVEIGQAHTPWLDHESHTGWKYRIISKGYAEQMIGASSSDRGIDFKTKLENFSSEVGVFNGEGYHGEETNEEISFGWRLTAHLLGAGTKKAKNKNTYANISYFGQKGAKTGYLDWNGIHAVYNQPEFLIAAQYVDVSNSTDDDGYSINGEYRFMPQWNLIARYDNFDAASVEKERTIAGVAYKYNKNVEFIANTLVEKNNDIKETDALMLSAEINW